MKEVGHPKGGIYLWECECSCENHTHIIVDGNHLRSGNTKSCGCLHKEQLRERNIKNRIYAKEDARLVRIWRAMRHRCYSVMDTHYDTYGGKGIEVCEEWQEFENFKEWALTHGYSEELTIHRIDNANNYCPENCVWADWETQANHTSSNKMITYQGKTQSLSMWAKELNLNYYRIKARLNACHWSVEEAFNSPKYTQINLYKNNQNKILQNDKE